MTKSKQESAHKKNNRNPRQSQIHKGICSNFPNPLKFENKMVHAHFPCGRGFGKIDGRTDEGLQKWRFEFFVGFAEWLQIPYELSFRRDFLTTKTKNGPRLRRALWRSQGLNLWWR